MTVTEGSQQNEPTEKEPGYFSTHRITIIRRVVQVMVMFLVNGAWLFTVILENTTDPSLKTVLFFQRDLSEYLLSYRPFLSAPRQDPFGGAGLAELMFGSFSQRIFPFLIIGVFMLVILVSGRAACGWLCPAGFVQDITEWVGEITGYSRNMGLSFHRFMVKVKGYLVILIFILVFPFIFMVDDALYQNYSNVLGGFALNPLAFWSMDEYIFVSIPDKLAAVAENGNLDPIFSNALFIVQALFFLVILALSVVYPRFYCRYLCPFAGIAAPVAGRGFIHLERNPVKCVGRRECGDCEAMCPMQVRLLDEPYTRISGNGECILCGKCVESCPHDALGLAFFK